MFYYFYWKQVCKLKWIAEPSSDYNLMFIFQTKHKSVYLPNQAKINLTKPNQTQTQQHQTKLIYTKPKSSMLNRTQQKQTKIIYTKPNSTIPNQTEKLKKVR